MNNRTKTILISVSALILVVLISSAYLLGKSKRVANQNPPTQNLTLPIVNQAANTSSSTPPPTESNSGWQTYENSDYRFNFRYPTGWTVKQVDANNLQLLSGRKSDPSIPPPYPESPQSFDIVDLTIRFLPKDQQTSLIDFYRQIPENPFQYAESTEIKQIYGKSAIILKNIPGMVSYSLAVLDFDSSIIEIYDYGNQHQNDLVFDRVVSSIQSY